MTTPTDKSPDPMSGELYELGLQLPMAGAFRLAEIAKVFTSKDEEIEKLLREWENAYREYKVERARANQVTFLLAVMAACAERLRFEVSDLTAEADADAHWCNRAVFAERVLSNLADAVGSAVIKAGICQPGPLTGPQLAMLVGDLASAYLSLEAQVEGLKRALEKIAANRYGLQGLYEDCASDAEIAAYWSAQVSEIQREARTALAEIRGVEQ